MSDAPERIWVQWPQPNGTGLAFTCQSRPPALREEYLRADLAAADAARIVELERQLAEAREVIEGIAACCHKPAPEHKPDYWHVRAGKHALFGRYMSAATRILSALKETP